jgi:hypothetical protein
LVDDVIVSSRSDTETALSRCLVDAANSSSPVSVHITFAHDWTLIRNDLNPADPSPIHMDQIYHVSQIYETGEEIQYQPRLDTAWFRYFDNLVNQLSELADDFIQKTTSSQFTRKQLIQRDDFHLWLEAEYKQLDTHESDGMFGPLCPRPQNSIVLRSIWSYMMKWDGTLKARNCSDGRPLRDAHYHHLEAVYTACVSQVGVKIFFALSALLNYVIYDLDAVNAFGQAGKLFEPIYLEIDIHNFPFNKTEPPFYTHYIYDTLV